jgi:DNA-binding CsgD family transcriptional regulator
VEVLSPQQIFERLDDSFRLLVGGKRTAPTRQQTLHATLDWSYSLLSVPERAVFARLAVFGADWSLEAAEAVCAAGEVANTDVLPLLRRLVDKSLVIVDETGGRSRYRLLEPVRQYAHEQLVIAGEMSEVRRRHAWFFLDFGEKRERATNVGGPERTTATGALLQEYPNIRLALGWCLDSGEGQTGLRLARTVQFLWQARGYPSEGLAWLERLLVTPGAEAPTPGRAVCMLAAGRLATLLGKMEDARTFYAAGVPLAGGISDPWVQWLGLQNFGVHAMACGDLDTSSRYLQEALSIASANDDHIDESISLASLSGIALYQHDYVRAQQLTENARRLAHVAGEDWAESFAVLRLGMLALLREDHSTAKREFEQALDLVRRHGDPNYIARAFEGLGLVAIAEAEHEEAFAYLAESLHNLDDIGNRPDIADCLESFAALAFARSRTEEAIQLAGAATAVREGIGAVQHPLRRDLVERWLPDTRRRVAADVYARNWEAGRELTIQEAIALALSIRPSRAVDSTSRARDQNVDVAGLSARELEVLRLVARGQSNKEIAAELVLSVRTVERHITNIYSKIDARGKADATAYAIHHGIV